MGARRLISAMLASMCAVVGVLALGGAAQAALVHEYLSQITEIPAVGPHGEAVASHGTLKGAAAMTVDDGHLWTVEDEGGEAEERVDEFGASSGQFEFQQGWPTSFRRPGAAVALGHSTAETELYVPLKEKAQERRVVGVFGPTGNLQGAWTGADAPASYCFEDGSSCNITGVAVDDSQNLSDWAVGDVYVATASYEHERDDNIVAIFKPEADGKEQYVGQLPGPEPGGLFAEGFERYLTVDQSNGDVLVGEGQLTPEPVVYVYEPSVVVGQYTLKLKLTGAGSPTGMFSRVRGVAGDDGDIYAIDDGEAGEVVDQFDSAGDYLGHLTGAPGHPFSELRSITVDPESHKLYVSDAKALGGKGAIDVFGPSLVVPDVATEPGSNVRARSATLNGTVDPDEAGAATCSFVWGAGASFGKVAPCEPEGVANGNGPLAVHAALSGLAPDTIYHFRLQASNARGTNPSDASQDQEFTTPGPGVQGSVSAVTSTSATLSAGIDPNSAATTYYFQYGTSVAYGSSVPAPPGLSVGAAKGDVGVSLHLQGLAPGTTYHYRVVAIAEPDGELVRNEGPDETFATQATSSAIALPDGRVWEMVSPPNKQGSGIFALDYEGGSDIQASVSGDGITYTADSPFVANPAGSRSLEATQVISNRRSPGSWETADITTAHYEGPTQPAIGQTAEYKLFSSDLSLGLVQPEGHTPLPPLPAGSEKTIYFREADGAYKALITSANATSGAKFGGTGEIYGGFQFVSASPDLSHVVVQSQVALLKGAPSTGGLYEWAGGQLRLISILPKGKATSKANLGDEGYDVDGVVRHAISNDGSRIVWEGEGEDYYLRDMAKEETVQIDAAQEGLPETGGAAHYRTANSEGSRVFFTSARRLTANSTAERESEDLYVFEVTSGSGEPLAGKLTDLTVDANAAEGARVQGVIGASEDGSYVYFVAGGLLGDAAEHGAEGGHYLYMEHYEVGTKAWTAPQFVAALSAGDGPTWGNGNVADLTGMTSRVSPDGRYLAFMSERSLTGYENRDANSGVPDEEVFLYNADADSMVCASCNPTGNRPVGLEVGNLFDERLIDYRSIWKNRWLAGNVPGWTSRDLSSALYQSRYLSDSGRLFFNSADALVPADVNGKEDVYEYEPEGIGSCHGADHGQSASAVFSENGGGCVALISAGTSSEEAAFMDASESGGDVFFLTLSRLSPSDYDTSIDMYDAHECTAAAPCAPEPPLTPPPCTTGDACKPGPTPQPVLFGAPSSETFSGAGNIVASPAGSTATAKSKAKSQAQQLTKALKACKKKAKPKRAKCERQAKRKYGAQRSRVGKSVSARTRR